ncbi:MAG: DUF192 domain-containing protein [Bacteriovoracaceae bacterium]|nr:DUF192 domain-containing protein [Bacteriovoracaceae bacterium]
MAITSAEQTQGLSGVQPADFQDNEAMLFFNLYDDTRYFWMPDTYFDLDLFYLNADLVIIDIDRNLPHYVGRENPDSIPRARPIYCRHVLEMKATSPLAKKMQIGDQLIWKGPYSLEQTTQGIRQYR